MGIATSVEPSQRVIERLNIEADFLCEQCRAANRKGDSIAFFMYDIELRAIREATSKIWENIREGFDHTAI